MNFKNKATKINLFNFKTPQMRAFHITWFAFFLCFVAWFGIAPLMAVVREDLHLTKEQVGNTIIASVAITIIARLIFGWLCDRIGPRLSYTFLLVFGSLPIMGIGLAQNYETFLLFRLAIGAIGASFVITQYHASIMFAPNVVGTANATTAGWGNMGGGATQFIMPFIFTTILTFGVGETLGWRLAMLVPGVALFLMGIAYYFLTQDAPNGNFAELRAKGEMPAAAKVKGAFTEAIKDTRVWALAGIYAACFGLELTIDNIAALYFTDYFSLDLQSAGLVAGTFGMMSLFARALGGYASDKINLKSGLQGRVRLLLVTVFLEGVALIIFSRMTLLPVAIGMLMLTALFVKMSEGATYAVVPFINKRALGSVAGIVAAGGNVGAVLFGFLFKSESLTWPQALLILGIVVIVSSSLALLVRFSSADEKATRAEIEAGLSGQEAAPAVTAA